MSLTASQAATMLECSTSMVRVLCRRKQLRGTKDTAGQWIIQNDDLYEFLAKKAFRVAFVAKQQGLHPETLRRWLRENKLTGKKEGHWLLESYNLPKHRKSSPRRKK